MPWSLGSEVHVDHLHARENVHIDGDPIALSSLTENLTGVAHGLGVGAMHYDASNNVVTFSTTGQDGGGGGVDLSSFDDNHLVKAFDGDAVQSEIIHTSTPTTTTTKFLHTAAPYLSLLEPSKPRRMVLLTACTCLLRESKMAASR